MLRGLSRSKELGWWSTQSGRFSSCSLLPLAPPVSGFLMDRTRSAPLALLLALPPVILYDASV
jgi:hypothetical protein